MTYRVGISNVLFNSDGNTLFDSKLLQIFGESEQSVEWERLPPITAVTPEITNDFDALYLFLEPVTESSFDTASPKTKIIARHGVGFDSVDLTATSNRGILVTNTPLAVRKPVATMALTFVLALAQRLLVKDKLTRTGGWAKSFNEVGMGLTGRTIGIVGAGGIGREIARRSKAFDMNIMASDPYANAVELAAEGIQLVALDTLLEQADFVVLACLLTPETKHLISVPQFAKMKPTSYIVNVARGPVINEAALIDALRRGEIAGAGLDVFEQEPVAADNPLLAMPNTIVTPHGLCLTDESFNEIARTAITSVVDASSGREPTHLVNRNQLKELG